ncbi:hypothetical protein DPEC_G00334280 [Dallia pectoralis]|uniref:Uncharacterized protein n=1 Tax=Dallia pectoralis TaxID=75939 RepID=A0ACC2F6T7_DALPE|nr:hypothetical protein DPEC_G00334280 [Dallia pectoralis]
MASRCRSQASFMVLLRIWAGNGGMLRREVCACDSEEHSLFCIDQMSDKALENVGQTAGACCYEKQTERQIHTG